jgi:hypothetical protein
MMKIDPKAAGSVERAVRTGYNWYLNQQENDGSFKGILPADSAAYYNVLYMYYLGGAWEKAEKFTRWARKNIIEPDKTSCIDPDGIYANRDVYFKGWNIFGAHMCGFFDLSLGAIDRILTYQDKQNGGFFCSIKRAHTEEGLIDFNATSLAGLAALVTGKTGEAVMAADCAARMISLQPDLPHKIYAYLDPKKNELLTETPDYLSDSSGMDNIYGGIKTELNTDIDIYMFCLDNDKRDEIGAYAGLSMALVFICCMSLTFKKNRYKQAAWKLFEFLDYAGDRCWIEGQTTKVLWGLVLLHTITHDEKVLRGIEKLAKHLCDTQVEGKGWVSPLIGGGFDQQPAWASLAITGDVLIGLKNLLRYI